MANNNKDGKILDDFNELMGMININGKWYVSNEEYHQIQAERAAKAAKKAQQANVQPIQKPKNK